jgi:hypothetical protein
MSIADRPFCLPVLATPPKPRPFAAGALLGQEVVTGCDSTYRFAREFIPIRDASGFLALAQRLRECPTCATVGYVSTSRR